jgi:hypothetical protein
VNSTSGAIFEIAETIVAIRLAPVLLKTGS